MQFPPESEADSEICIEKCNLYRELGYTVVAMIANIEIGKLCVLRKSDFTRPKASTPLHLVEFYNIIDPPHIVFEKALPIEKVILEDVVWLGDLAIVSCADGALLAFSPFSTDVKRFQLCASPILASAALSSTQMIAGSDSSEIFLFELSPKDGIFLKRTIHLTSDQRVISVAASSRLPLIAAGLINSIQIVDLSTDKHVNIVVPQEANKATIVWSLLFSDSTLFSGDSRGKVTVYNAKTGAVWKVISCSEAAVLTLCADGENVYASGVDYRIQVIKAISTPARKVDWANVGQRIIHENDVRAMACVGSWLVSGGAEHEICISDRTSRYHHPVGKNMCHSNATSDLLAFQHPYYVDLWRKPQLPDGAWDSGKSTAFIEDNAKGPLCLAQVQTERSAYISDVSLTPNGRLLCIATGNRVDLYTFSGSFSELKVAKSVSRRRRSKQHTNSPLSGVEVKTVARIDEEHRVTAVAISNEKVYYATDAFHLKQSDFANKASRSIVHKPKLGDVLRMKVNESSTLLLALTAKCQVFAVRLEELMEDDDEREVVTEIELEGVPTDFTFISDTIVAILMSGSTAIIVYDIENNRAVGNKITNEVLFDDSGEFAVSISPAWNSTIIVTGNRGNYRVVSDLHKPSRLLMAQDNTSIERGTGWSKSQSKKLVPLWGSEVPANTTDSSQGRLRSAILVTVEPASVPSQKPMKIRRFDRN